MELRELAERVLHGASLAEKLTRAEELTDHAPGRPLGSAPALPARGQGLELHARARTPFPKLGALQAAGQRGALLHAFANHELLALELMALALLRFADAPASYRLGLAHTLREEQEHLRLYLGRMQALGVTLGEAPLSAYFWRAMATLETPLQFVAAMNLTFEQANLDHALAYAAALRQAGDPDTAAILQRVHDEELGHVRHGLTWFDRWRDPGLDRWEAYRQALPAPLSPARAKGLNFSWASRAAVGLDERFQRELFVFSRSRGRPPFVYAFNPGCEQELADGRADWQAPKVVQALEQDCAPLLALVATRDDALLVPRRPSLEFRVELQGLGVVWPEFVEDLDELSERGVSGLRPWGWTPAMAKRLSALGHATPEWVSDGTARELSSKRFGLEALEAFGSEGPVGWFETREADALTRAEAILRDSPWVVFKAPWSSSGRGLLRAQAGVPLSPAERGRLRSVLREQGGVLVEPWLERVCDLSVQLEVGDPGTSPRAHVTRQLVDARGQYRGHVLGRPLAGLTPEQVRAIHEGGFLKELERAGRFVADRLADRGFRGPAGVDAFVYRESGALRLRPIVEVNPRTTMGHVALALERRIRPGRVGLWVHAPKAGVDASALSRGIQLGGAPARIEAGLVFTTDPTQARARVSLLAVGESLEGCWEQLAQVGIQA